MTLVYSPHSSGLVVAHQGADEASIRRALKQFDDRLMLDYAVDPDWDRFVWQVLCRTGTDTPPQVVCRWRDESSGAPLPLSHGLVEKVKHLHMNSRAPRVDAEAENDRMRDQIRAQDIEELEFYATELVGRLKGTRSSVLPRGGHRRRTAFANVTEVR